MKIDPYLFPAPREMSLPRRAARPASVCPRPPAMTLFGCPPGALEVLRARTVAVVGCGSVGGRIALLLARMGIGGLLLSDPKLYKPASVFTHDIDAGDVGHAKATVTARRCKAVSPVTRVRAFAGPVEELELVEMGDVDLFVMAPDLLSVEVTMAQRCLWLARPLIQSSVHGLTLTAQTRLFLNAKAAGACPACCYGPAEWELLTRQVRFSCEGASGSGAPAPNAAPATNSVGAVCSIAADLAVIQCLRFLAGAGQPVADTMTEYCGFNHRTVVTPLARHPNCRLDHTAWARVFVEGPLSSLSLAEMTRRATSASPAHNALFEVAGADWVEFAACACRQPKLLRRFVPRGQPELADCPVCERPLVPLNFYTHRSVSASVLGSAIDQPLHKLGIRRAAGVVLRTGDSGVLVRSQPSTSPTP